MAPEQAVLVVEDPFVSNYLISLLAQRGYVASMAGVGGAVRRLRTEAGREKILITDVPEEFLEFAQQTPGLYLSGAPDPSVVSRFRACRVIRKPFRAEQFLAALEELCAARARAEGA